MIIRPLDKKDIDTYDNLCLRFGTIFNSSAWLRIFNDVQIFGIYDESGTLAGGFHLFSRKLAFFSVIRDAPFTPTTGPFYDDSNVTKHNYRLNLEKKIISALSEFLTRRKMSVISLSLSRSVIDTQPFFWQNFKVIAQYTYRIPLAPTEEEIWESFSRKKRQNIKKVELDFLTI